VKLDKLTNSVLYISVGSLSSPSTSPSNCDCRPVTLLIVVSPHGLPSFAVNNYVLLIVVSPHGLPSFAVNNYVTDMVFLLL
jgi:hypothetical protein